ncbi:hypothetical protein KR222_007812 [Zaprionus bogoriensis]|nr:hypothetical protein KR222_007812 [Zaprionus bogoriensis]
MPGISRATQTTASDLLLAVQLRLEQLQKLLPECKVPQAEATVVGIEPKHGNSFLWHEASGNSIVIGGNQTRANQALYEAINWDCYSLATRALLDAVFDKETLASRTLTGRGRRRNGGSGQLDPLKVDDIIETVKRKCQVSAILIRKIIINKCSDTARSKRFKRAHNAPSRRHN